MAPPGSGRHNRLARQNFVWTSFRARAIHARMKKGDHLFLVDGSGFIFRAFHALPPLTRKSDGLPVGAVSGFCNMLWKLLRDARNTDVGVTPTHLAVIFDYSAKTFRKDLYDAYKANRSAPPEELIPQFGLIREATRAFNLPCIETEALRPTTSSPPMPARPRQQAPTSPSFPPTRI